MQHNQLCTAKEASICAQVMQLPPHGPFAYLTAGTVAWRHSGDYRIQPEKTTLTRSESKSTEPSVTLEDALAATHLPILPAEALNYMQQKWNLSHMRNWSSFYTAAELRPEDVDNL